MQIHDSKEPFLHFTPTLWQPPGDSGKGVYSVLREHGVRGRLVLHNSNDRINSSHTLLERVLLEYRIGHHSYSLFTIKDLFAADYAFSEEGWGNIMGDIAERISRRVTKFFLKHHSPEGNTGGIFDKRFNPQEKNGYIITHNEQYLLKIQNYPNLIILKNSPEAAWEYENIKELDGFFDYRYHGDRHIIVLESKLDKLHINVDKLKQNLFTPLKSLFPDSKFHYILFSNSHSLFRENSRYKILRSRPYEIFKALKEDGVGTLFFSFNEQYHEFEQAAKHLITQYRMISHQNVDLYGRITMGHNEIHLYDSGEHPFMTLQRDPSTGLWREQYPVRLPFQ